MIKLLFIVIISHLAFYSQGKPPEVLKLNPPNMDGGLALMTTLAQRASSTEFDSTLLSMQDLSNLLWAANGINRPESGMRTASSAMNSKDIDVYLVKEKATYLYSPKEHQLTLVSIGDHRSLIAGHQQSVMQAPAIILLVSDISRFSRGENNQKLQWAAIDAGIVTQNVLLFCASFGLAARPRASMNLSGLREVLNLTDSQHLMMNIPVGHPKK